MDSLERSGRRRKRGLFYASSHLSSARPAIYCPSGVTPSSDVLKGSAHKGGNLRLESYFHLPQRDRPYYWSPLLDLYTSFIRLRGVTPWMVGTPAS